MLKNHFKTIIRSLFANRWYSLTNLLGLSIGLCAFIFVMFWVKDELTFDTWHHNAENIYRINSIWNKGTENEWNITNSPGLLGIQAEEQLPEIENIVRFFDKNNQSVTYKSQGFLEENFAYVDPSYFYMFDFKLAKGDKTTVFKNPNSIVMTKSKAHKYFGNSDPLGKTITLDDTLQVTVTGILENIPSNSNFQFDILAPIQLVPENTLADWSNYNYPTYIQTTPSADLAKVEKTLVDIYNTARDADNGYFYLQPVIDIHLNSNQEVGEKTSNKKVVIWLLAFIGFLILLIACINYANLATAQATTRAKEVSIRKIIGASSKSLISRFLMESGVLIISAFFIGLIMVFLFFPYFIQLVGKEITVNFFDINVIGIILASLLLSFLLAGIYPAFLTASFNPLSKMKSNNKLIKNTDKRFGKSLVVVQFAFTIALILATLVINSQMDFLKNKNLGYNHNNVFSFKLDYANNNKIKAIKTELEKNVAVQLTSTSNMPVFNNQSSTTGIDWEGKDKNVIVSQLSIDNDFVEMFNLKAKEGSLDMSKDRTTFLLNEKAVEILGFDNPIGKKIKFQGSEGLVGGVVKNFHFRSLHHEIDPLVFFKNEDWWQEVYVSSAIGDTKAALVHAENVWKKFFPKTPFQYRFADSEYLALYEAEQRSNALIFVASLLCIFLSCLGLLAMVTFSITQRTKEIGIRKVLGASAFHIVNLFTKDYLKLILMALVLAFPLGWYGMNKWLEGFAYRIEISWEFFVMAAVIGIGAALITISLQTLKAALVNPTESIKSE